MVATTAGRKRAHPIGHDRWKHWLAFVLSALLILVSCTSADDDDNAEDDGSELPADEAEPPGREESEEIFSPVFPAIATLGSGEVTSSVAYSDAADWLRYLDPLEQIEQILDWTRLSLAELLEFDPEGSQSFFFDKAPVRDPLLEDLTRADVGPGRYLSDGVDTVHLLLPTDDPFPERTLALTLDDARLDYGEDLPRVRVHQYQIDSDAELVTIESQSSVDTADFRAQLGYEQSTVASVADLETLLSVVDHLSRVVLEDQTIVAEGWDWPEATPSGQVSIEDIAVLATAYGGNDTEPAFSLDPAGSWTRNDLEIILPTVSADVLDLLEIASVSPDLLGAAESILEGAFDAPDAQLDPEELDAELSALGFNAEEIPYIYELLFLILDVDQLLFNSDPPLAFDLPEDVTSLYTISRVLDGGSPFAEANYYGGIDGTEVGMTMFYTDWVAKDWIVGVGTGTPETEVAGFPTAVETGQLLAANDCASSSESGRLWFGLTDDGTSYRPNDVLFGTTVATVFSRSDSTDGRGVEVERSFAFGRELRWWDVYYQAVADYEPQYHRLDQLFRWSAVMSWLAAVNGELPTLPSNAADRSLRFEEWYATNSELKERRDIAISSSVPSATAEEVFLTMPSVYDACGGRSLRGGVSLPSRIDSSVLDDLGDIDRPLRRADTYGDRRRDGDRLVLETGDRGPDGLTEIVRREFSDPSPEGGYTVDVAAFGREVQSLGPARQYLPDGLDRSATILHTRSGRAESIFLTEINGTELGRVRLTSGAGPGQTVSVGWQSGAYGHIRQFLADLIERLRTSSFADAIRDSPFAQLFQLTDEGGALVRLDDNTTLDLRRVDLLDGSSSTTGEGMMWAVGAPGESRYHEVGVATDDVVARVGGESGWVVVDRAGSGAIGPASEQVAGSDRLTFRTVDNRRSEVSDSPQGLVFRADSDVFGPDGITGSGTAFRYWDDLIGLSRRPVDPNGPNPGIRIGDQVAVASGDGDILLLQADQPASRTAKTAGLDEFTVTEVDGVWLVVDSPLDANSRPIADTVVDLEDLVIPPGGYVADSLLETPSVEGIMAFSPGLRRVRVLEFEVPNDVAADRITHNGQTYRRAGAIAASGATITVVLSADAQRTTTTTN